MKGSWRDRPLGLAVLAAVAPVGSLHPFRGQGRSINEPKPVGIRDLVAPPGDVKLRPERRWYVIGGFFFLLFLLLVGRLYVLTDQGPQAVGRAGGRELDSLRVTRYRRRAGLILDRNGTPLVNNVTTVEIRLSRAEATLDPTIEGTLASLTGPSVNQIASDLANQAVQPLSAGADPRQRAREHRAVHQAAPRRVSRAYRCWTSRHARTRLGGSVGSQVLGYVGPIRRTRSRRTPAPATRPTRRSAIPASRRSTSSTCAARTGRARSKSAATGNVHRRRCTTTQPTGRRLGRAQHRRRTAEGARRDPEGRHLARPNGARPAFGYPARKPSTAPRW